MQSRRPVISSAVRAELTLSRPLMERFMMHLFSAGGIILCQGHRQLRVWLLVVVTKQLMLRDRFEL